MSSSSTILKSKDLQTEDADDEPDYMSDAFLQSLEDPKRANPKPDAMPRNKRQDVEAVLRDGLSKPVPQENIGFKLLSKMGYSASSEHASQGPIDIHLKRDRTGIGIAEEARKQTKLMIDEEAARHMERVNNEGHVKEQFRKSQSSKFESRRYRGQFKKLTQVETNLYEKLNLEPPPQVVQQNDPAEINLDDNEEVEAPTPVVDSTSPEDREIHSEVEYDTGMAPVQPLPEMDSFVEPDYETLVAEKVAKLRAAPFFYCFYCGAQYTNEEDLVANCPGDTEEAHD